LIDRKHVAFRASAISLVANATLSTAKIVIGLLSGSMAVLADGIDSSFDATTSVVTYVSSAIASKPPDRDHPYGHERAETVAAKVIAMLIFFAGAQLALSSFGKLFGDSYRIGRVTLALSVSGLSAVAKYALYRYKKHIGKKIDSSVFIAYALNMRSDVWISGSVFVGLLMVQLTGIVAFDAILGILVSVMIIRTALSVFFETSYELMDGIPAKNPIYQDIFYRLKDVPGVINPHKMRIRKMGSKYLVDLDIEVDPTLSVRQAHAVSKRAERAIKNANEGIYDVHVHIEPTGNIEDENYGIDDSDIQRKNDD